MSACPVCGGAVSEPTHAESGFRYVRCASCDLVRMDPLPTPAEQARRHERYLPEHSSDPRTFDLKNREVWTRARRALLRRVGRGRVLDVGCGHGAFLALMEAAGWETTGLEVCDDGLALARKRGLRVLRSSVEDADLEPGSFDAVTAFYVLEHVPRPMDFLAACHRLLAPGGLLYLRVPDTTPLKDRLARLGIGNRLYDAPFHVLDFSPRALRQALERAGFPNVEIRVGGFSIPVSERDRVLGVPTAVLGDVVDLATGGRVLLRGVSKSAIARRGTT